MILTLEASTGESGRFYIPLTKKEESEIMAKMNQNKDYLTLFNMVMGLIGIARANPS